MRGESPLLGLSLAKGSNQGCCRCGCDEQGKKVEEEKGYEYSDSSEGAAQPSSSPHATEAPKEEKRRAVEQRQPTPYPARAPHALHTQDHTFGTSQQERE